MPILIQDLQPGDEVQFWMRNGLAIRPIATAKGKPFYITPIQPRKAKNGDLTRFVGWVVVNEPGKKIITVHVAPFNSWRQPVSDIPPKQVDLAYSALQRARKISAVTFEARQKTLGDKGTRTAVRPGSVAGFGGTAFRPYRTVTEVLIK